MQPIHDLDIAHEAPAHWSSEHDSYAGVVLSDGRCGYVHDGHTFTPTDATDLAGADRDARAAAQAAQDYDHYYETGSLLADRLQTIAGLFEYRHGLSPVDRSLLDELLRDARALRSEIPPSTAIDLHNAYREGMYGVDGTANVRSVNG